MGVVPSEMSDREIEDKIKVLASLEIKGQDFIFIQKNLTTYWRVAIAREIIIEMKRETMYY